MKKGAFLATLPICILSLSACSSLGSLGSFGSSNAQTPGEVASYHGYVPLDPLPVNQTGNADSCKERGGPAKPRKLLESLPDITTRFAVTSLTASGSVGFATASAKGDAKSYRAVLDYINTDNVPVEFYIRRILNNGDPVSLSRAISDELIYAFEIEESPRYRSAAYAPNQSSDSFSFGRDNNFLSDDEIEVQIEDLMEKNYTSVTIPIYIGVGVRLSAFVNSGGGNIDLSGLSVIGAQAEARRLSGRLSVQTLGITGKSLGTALPMPSKLDQTTIENGILAIGTARALIYSANDSKSDVVVTPRVVGLDSPIGTNPKLINAIYSELSRVRPRWNRPCEDDNGLNKK